MLSCSRSRSRSPAEGKPGAQGRSLRRRLAFDEQPDQAAGTMASPAEPDAFIASKQRSSNSQSKEALVSGVLQHPHVLDRGTKLLHLGSKHRRPAACGCCELHHRGLCQFPVLRCLACLAS